MSLLEDQQPEVQETVAMPAGRRYWRSLDELERTPQFEEFLQREFPQGASEMLTPFSRRAFLNLMAASVAFGGALTGCRRPKQLILPYTRRPEDLTPGVARYYATAMERSGDVMGLLVESHEGRPTKLEGLPEHPGNLGSLDAMGQGAILELYDPDRSDGPLALGEKRLPAQFDEVLMPLLARLRAAQGAGLAVLMEKTSSPSLLAVREAAARALPQAIWHVWDAASGAGAAEGTRMAFGSPVEPLYDFSRAEVVVALDSDFLGSEKNHLHYSKTFMRRRRQEAGEPEMNRLYAIESNFSLTGAKADHRLRLAPSRVAAYALALCAELVHGQGAGVGGEIGEPLRASMTHDFDPQWITAVARDIRRRNGNAVLIAGPTLPPAVQMVVHQVNAAVGGNCVRYYPAPDPIAATGVVSIADLTQRMNAGSVDTLLILGGNPVWDAPADLNFGEALKQVPNSIHLSLYANETSIVSSWHTPRAHVLETWGDLRWIGGTTSIVQPLIAPLFDGRTDAEMLALVADLPEKRAYDIVRTFHRGARSETDFDPIWRAALHDGLVLPVSSPMAIGENPAAVAVTPAAGGGAALASYQAPAAPSAQALEVVFLPDSKVYDGRYANNGWLQEAPESTTKITWGNAALMGLETAKALGLGVQEGRGQQSQDIVALEVNGKSIELPIWIVPGIADFTVVVKLGYGRENAGRIGDGVGVNVYPLRTSQNLTLATGAKITKTGRRIQLACTQDHWAMEGRDLIREELRGEAATAAALAHDTHGDPHAAVQAGHGETGHGNGTAHAPDLWTPPFDFSERPQWGMVIDLNSCIGCNACLVACQSENNIPIVGPEQVLKGREMHWIRIDRYFAVDDAPYDEVAKASLSDPGYAADTAEMVFQPMPCQHCENAPCEQVCPVAATVHSPDGINEMTYNRCIGTRYCSNNCPFKVRRFNYFNNHEAPTNPLYIDLDKKDQALMHMASNPYVTVRSRGVMEKCTFCVQRVNKARHRAKQEDRNIRDGEVVSACAQTCPTEAITFGDILDPESLVHRKKSEGGNYTLLDALNVRPRVSYLPRLRNPNPELRA